MGTIRIEVGGSFEPPQPPVTFSAMGGGHAAALAEAIEWLSQRLPAAIRQDHALQAEGALPEDRFGLP